MSFLLASEKPLPEAFAPLYFNLLAEPPGLLLRYLTFAKQPVALLAQGALGALRDVRIARG